MTPEAQRIAIAEACGWTWSDGEEPCYGGSYKQAGWTSPTGEFYGGEWTCKSSSLGLPDYITDLNAMHEAEKVLKYFPDYLFHLREIVGPFPDAMSEWSDYLWQDVVHATAAQRAEAFLRTLNLYTSL